MRGGGGRFDLGLGAMLALANAAGFIAFMPLLTLMAPLRIEAVAPESKGVVLSGVILLGALVASLVNIVAGRLSDRTRSRFGRRRPWMWAGALGALAAYPVIAAAQTGFSVLIGVLLFQTSFNLFFAAMAAVLPDHVPDHRKGAVAGLLALGAPVGLACAAMLAAADDLSEGGRYWVVAALFCLGTTPLMLLWREPLGPTAPPSANAALSANRRRRDFALAWVSRLLIQIGLSASQSYTLYFVGAASGLAGWPDRPATALVSVLVLISTSAAVVAALGGGWLSDRTGARPFYVAASGLLVCAGLAVFAIWPTWHTAVVAQVVYGLGVGLYSSTDTAMVAQILPSRADSGRDLGLFNLGNTLPQAISPAIAIVVLAGDGVGALGGYPALFLAAGGCALLGGGAAAFVRGAR